MSNFQFSIKINGNAIPNALQVESIWIRKEFNKIPILKISFIDGGLSDDSFGVLATTKATPGSEIEVSIGYSTPILVFKGLITKHNFNYSESGFSIEIEGRDKAIVLTSGRKNEIFQKKKDSDIINDLVKSAGLDVSIEATTVQHEEIVQYSCSNWDFMLMRSELNSMLVSVSDNKIKVAKPELTASPKFNFTNGSNVFSLNLEIDSQNLYSKTKVVGWDYKEQKSLESEITSKSEIKFGNISSKKLSEVVNKEGYTLNTPLHAAQDKLQAWGEGKLLKAALSMIKGTLECEGNPEILVGDIISLDGFSDDFNGNLLVTAVEHELINGNWKTILHFGMPFSWFAEETFDIGVPFASGIVAPMRGLSTGIVTKIHEDPDGQYRVQVSLPVLGGDKGNLSVNARLANFYGSNSVGSFFYPEINDEVLLGFLNEDPHQPVILGMLYSSKNKPPFEPDDKNQFKGIVTKSKISIKIDDVDKILIISTPGENVFTLDDKEGQITLADKNKNTITMSKDGITLDSAKDIILKAKSNIKMEATSNIEMKATADLKGAGMNVNMEAQVGIVAKGSATAEISASGQTTVKGAIVMIN